MKRLFEIKTEGVHMYFGNKMHAKTVRDEMGDDGSIIIRRGPDHWRYGLKGNPRTHDNDGNVGTGFPKKVR